MTEPTGNDQPTQPSLRDLFDQAHESARTNGQDAFAQLFARLRDDQPEDAAPQGDQATGDQQNGGQPVSHF